MGTLKNVMGTFPTVKCVYDIFEKYEKRKKTPNAGFLLTPCTLTAAGASCSMGVSAAR